MSNFSDLTRAYTLLMSASPFFIALCCAANAQMLPDFQFLVNGILVLIAVVLVHMAANMFDDYLDVKAELKKGLQLNQINFNSKRKAKAILDGTFTMQQAEAIMIFFVSIAFLIGLYFIYSKGAVILSYMVIAALLSAFYPVSSKYGLSEIIIGVVFGPLLINGVYYALTGQMDPQVFNISVASGLMTVILTLTQSIMEYEHDNYISKKTIPVMLQDKNLSINIISILILLSWGILYYTQVKYNMSALILLGILLTIPVGVKLVKSLYEYIQIKDVKFIPRWYFGAMENWEEIQQRGFSYFMYRFYLARNLAIIFNLTIAIVCLYCFNPIKSFDLNFFRFVSGYFIF